MGQLRQPLGGAQGLPLEAVGTSCPRCCPPEKTPAPSPPRAPSCWIPPATLEPGIPAVPAGGRRRHRHGGHQRRGGAHRQRVAPAPRVFAMVVLEQPLSKVYPEIDLVTTPDGQPGGHGPRATPAPIETWTPGCELFGRLPGGRRDQKLDHESPAVRAAMYRAGIGRREPTAAAWSASTAYSGEPVSGLEEGRPLLVRCPESDS